MELYNEDEQVEILKRWWKKYGMSIIVGVIIGVIAMYGWQYWQGYEKKIRIKASMEYQQLMSAYTVQPSPQVIQQAKQLIKDMPNTTYAAVASLILAKQAVMQEKWLVASQHLQWVMDHSKQSVYQQVARLRLARIKLEQKQYDKAWALLKTVDDKAYRSAIEDIKGDILIAQGNNKAAREAYASALEATPKKSAMRAILLMKLNSMSGQLNPGGLA